MIKIVLTDVNKKMIRIFANHNTSEKIMMVVQKHDIGEAMKKLNQEKFNELVELH